MFEELNNRIFDHNLAWREETEDFARPFSSEAIRCFPRGIWSRKYANHALVAR